MSDNNGIMNKYNIAAPATARALYIAAAITGFEANPNRRHESDKEVSHALRIADMIEAAEKSR